MRSEDEIRKKKDRLEEIFECEDIDALCEFCAMVRLMVLDWVLEE